MQKNNILIKGDNRLGWLPSREPSKFKDFFFPARNDSFTDSYVGDMLYYIQFRHFNYKIPNDYCRISHFMAYINLDFTRHPSLYSLKKTILKKRHSFVIVMNLEFYWILHIQTQVPSPPPLPLFLEEHMLLYKKLNRETIINYANCKVCSPKWVHTQYKHMTGLFVLNRVKKKKEKQQRGLVEKKKGVIKMNALTWNHPEPYLSPICS